MGARPKLEVAGTIAAALLVIAFIASFAVGLRSRGRATSGNDEPGVVQTPPLVAAGRVEVLNASAVRGLARAATNRLRDSGFDVVFFGTAASSRDSSLVLDRTGKDAVARAAARALGIARVQTQIDTSLYLDATVILGKDWSARDQ